MVEKLWKDKKHIMWFPITFTEYSLSVDRLFVKKGLMTTTQNELLLYRISDLTISQTLAQKLFGTGTITVSASDKSTPKLEVVNVKRVYDVKETLHQLIEKNKKLRGVRSSELMNSSIDISDIDEDGNGIADAFE